MHFLRESCQKSCVLQQNNQKFDKHTKGVPFALFSPVCCFSSVSYMFNPTSESMKFQINELFTYA